VYQRELEERERKLKQEHRELMVKEGSGTAQAREMEDRVRVLEAQVGEVEGDNRRLQAKLEYTSSEIGSFIGAMNGMMEQPEVLSALNMDVEDLEDCEEDYLDDDEAAKNGMYTGGIATGTTAGLPWATSGTMPANGEAGTEYTEGRPHAGTGGSSNMRTRPNHLH
jgi:chromosome segregation ATPase